MTHPYTYLPNFRQGCGWTWVWLNFTWIETTHIAFWIDSTHDSCDFLMDRIDSAHERSGFPRNWFDLTKNTCHYESTHDSIVSCTQVRIFISWFDIICTKATLSKLNPLTRRLILLKYLYSNHDSMDFPGKRIDASDGSCVVLESIRFNLWLIWKCWFESAQSLKGQGIRFESIFSLLRDVSEWSLNIKTTGFVDI